MILFIIIPPLSDIRSGQPWSRGPEKAEPGVFAEWHREFPSPKWSRQHGPSTLQHRAPDAAVCTRTCIRQWRHPRGVLTVRETLLCQGGWEIGEECVSKTEDFYLVTKHFANANWRYFKAFLPLLSSGPGELPTGTDSAWQEVSFQCGDLGLHIMGAFHCLLHHGNSLTRPCSTLHHGSGTGMSSTLYMWNLTLWNIHP